MINQAVSVHYLAGALTQNDSPMFNPPPYNHRYPITINQNYVANGPVYNANCISSNATFTAIDQELDIMYGIVTSNYFTINSTSGVVSLSIDAKDLPVPGPVTAILYCKYPESESSSTVELSVRYRIENVHVPKFDHGDQVLDVWVREDHLQAQGHFVAQLNVTDDDLEPCNIVTFTIASGNVGGVFRIGSQTGTLEITTELDYDTQSKYNLTIRATNTECGQRRYSAEISVFVYVVDIDDEHPTFDQHLYTFEFDELQQPTNFVQLRCSDIDTPEAQIVYEEGFPLHEHPFTINHHNGNVSTTAMLDYEQQTGYHLTFVCYNVLIPSIQDTAVVKIVVNPVNEYLPDVSPTFAFIRVNYTSPEGLLIASTESSADSLVHLTVNDRDHGSEHGKVLFKFADISPNHKYFQLDSESGNLTLIRPFDFDICSDDAVQSIGAIQLRVVVCDTLQDRSRLEQCPIVVIYVAIVSPSCTLAFLQESYTVNISESAGIGSELVEVRCETPGKRNGTKLKHTIETFSPDSQFEHTLRIEDDTVILQEPLDYEKVRQFAVYLRCSDTEGQESIASVNVHVLPENDVAPYFEKTLYTFRIYQDLVHPLPFTVGYVTAIDEDKGMITNLTYSVSDNGFTTNGSQYYTYSVIDNGSLAITMVTMPKDDLTVLDVNVSDGVSTAQSSILVYLLTTASASKAQATDQCGTFCIVLLVILIIYMLLTVLITAVVLCVCLVTKMKRKTTEATLEHDVINLKEYKSHSSGYSSLYGRNLEQSSCKQ